MVAERLRAAVEAMRTVKLGSPFGVVLVSVGVASALLHDDAGAASLVEAADRTLYEAKCAGRNQVRSMAFQEASGFNRIDTSRTLPHTRKDRT